MLTSISLMAAINESSFAYTPSNDIIAESFTGLDAIQAIDAGIGIVTNEAADFMRFAIGSNELLIENTLSQNPNLEALSENVFTGIIENVKKFFRKMVEVVKGILQKIQAYFYALTGKTNKWAELMTKKINSQASGVEVKVEMHEWKQDEVLTGLGNKASSLVDYYSESIKKRVDTAKGMADMYSTTAFMNKDSNPDAYDGKMDEFRERNTKDDEANTEKYAAEIKKRLNVDVNELSDITSALTKEVNGGDVNTVTVSSSNANSMLTVIKGASKTRDGLEKSYKKYLKVLDDALKTLDKIKPDTMKMDGEKDAKNPRAFTDARERIKIELNNLVKHTNTFHSVIENVRKVNLSCLDNMTREYMTALNKYAGGKPEKK